MISSLINFLIFVHMIGFFGAIISSLSLFYRFRPSDLRKFPILIFLYSIPIINYCIMWECFKAYDDYTKEENGLKAYKRYEQLKNKTARVNNGKGI